jgi:hypothetical protein
MGTTVKKFRKQVHAELIECGPVSIGDLSITTPSPDFELSLNAQDTDPESFFSNVDTVNVDANEPCSDLKTDDSDDIHKLRADLQTLRNEFTKQQKNIADHLRRIDEILKENEISYLRPKPWATRL